MSENYDSIVEYDADGSAFVDNFIPAGDEEDLYAGHRRIEDSDLKLLSEKITEVIRTRGVAKILASSLIEILTAAILLNKSWVAWIKPLKSLGSTNPSI